MNNRDNTLIDMTQENDFEANKRKGSCDTTIKEDTFVETGDFGEVTGNINVEDAIEKYDNLKKELSRISQISSASGKGLENVSDDDEFDLNEYLHNMHSRKNEAGHQPKHLGVIWRDLSVEGLAPDAHTIPTISSGILHIFQFWKYFGIGVKNKTQVILKPFSGFAKDGELVLVLGRPGSGCTTLLKIIANIRSSFTTVNGTVNYGGIDHATFSKRFLGQTCYNSEEDQHYPTLTTKQTLKFALRTKTPGTRLPNETKKEFINKILYLMGNMLGLTKQMNTMIGNAFVRGLSGGERKRLSIAEQMTTQSTINCWDCSTRGLDAASALDFVKSLRIMTDIFQKTTVATLYQASEKVYHLFDKVILLDDGYCLYFGPVSKAKDYFQQMGFHCPPRKSTPDFLTSLCNPLEREIRSGFENAIPMFASEFQERFTQSTVYKEIMVELDQFEELFERENPSHSFKNAMDEEHEKYAFNSSPYTASFLQQVVALTIRQYQLQIKDHQAIISRYGSILIQALVLGSVFYQLPLDSTGAAARTGIMYFVLVFCTLVSQTELVNFLTGRPILEKHKQFALYRPSAFYIAQIIMDIPFSTAQVFIFINMTMNAFFRFFGAITTSVFLCSQASGVVFLCCFIYCGYLVPYETIHPWFVWFYWINPLSYAYNALVINEMHGQSYSCEGPGNAVPYGPEYNNWNFKVCIMKGGNPGENFVLGDNYLAKSLNFYPQSTWVPNFVAIIGLFLVMGITTALAIEFMPAAKSGTLTKLYLRGKAPKRRTKVEEEARNRKQSSITEQINVVSDGTIFSWQDVNYMVPSKRDGSELHLLNGISGIVKPGHLTALMGSSGAGKTTLLDVLARRKTMGKVDGRFYLNGEDLINDFERITGYCEQMDIHHPISTVREALQFSANLRQPVEVSQEDKYAYVEQIIQLLEMGDIADAQVGDIESGYGISIEERKRLTIAIELVGKPHILFLDEPTSGLDAQSSFNIIRFIRKLADSGWPVLCTIHQPSSILFEHFDHLLLLVRGGCTAYYGEIGKDASTMISYFERNGGPVCSPDANPAEYILEVVGGGTSGKIKRDWGEIWNQSPEAEKLKSSLEYIHQMADHSPQRKALTYSTPMLTQLYYVHKRMVIGYWRSPEYNFGRFVTIMAISLVSGFSFWKLSDSIIDAKNRMFLMYLCFIIAYIVIFLAQPKFMSERIYFRREYASRYYGWIPFTLSIIVVEIPYLLFFSTSLLCGIYWTAGLSNTPDAVGYFYLMIFFFIFWAVTLGFLLAAVTENPTLASILNPLLNSPFFVVAGLMQPVDAMPLFWSSWFYWLNPIHYFVEGLSVNELQHIIITCSESDLVRFSPPPGRSCGEYTRSFFTSGASGYIDNPDSVQPETCAYCEFSTGEELYSTFDWSESNRWRNLGVIVAFFIFNMFCLAGTVYWKRKAKR
ncbi:hypothetical protein K501DRAFT_300849 [Backusella circina FSU 941]|nr:hypothetical protein K501DRAFT_300849 [Backusella circina FSU 941]